MDISPNSSPFFSIFGETKISGAAAMAAKLAGAAQTVRENLRTPNGGGGSSVGAMMIASSKLRLGKSLGNGFFDSILLLGAQQPAVDAPLYRVQQFQPILQRRFLNCPPLVVAVFARVENPIAAHVLGVHLEAYAFIDRKST